MKKVKVHLALLSAGLIYGANYTIAKEAMPHYIQPFGFILIRVVCAALLFTTIHFLIIKEKVARKDMVRLFFCGIFGVALNQLMFFKGLNLTTPINASLMMITAPITVLILSAILKTEKLTLIKSIGITLGASGAFLIIFWEKEIAFTSITAMGDIFVLVNASSYAAYLVLVKPLMSRYHPITVIKWIFLFGSIFVVPVGFEEFGQIQWSSLPISIWLVIGYVVLFTTFFAYLLNILALSKVPPSVVGIYIYLQPVIASAIALAFDKDHLTVIKIIGASLIFSGVYLVGRKLS